MKVGSQKCKVQSTGGRSLQRPLAIEGCPDGEARGQERVHEELTALGLQQQCKALSYALPRDQLHAPSLVTKDVERREPAISALYASGLVVPYVLLTELAEAGKQIQKTRYATRREQAEQEEADIYGIA